MDASNYSSVIKALSTAQGDIDECEMRDHAHEADEFLTLRDGQWEPSVYNQFSDQPRYTFDLVGPIVDQIVGELSSAEFAIKIKPTSIGASDDVADLYEGLVRSIQNNSDTSAVYLSVSRDLVVGGLSGLEVTQEWLNSDSFEQDLFIRPIPNYINRVWFDPSATNQDASDAEWAVKLTTMQRKAYNDKFPDGSGRSVDSSGHSAHDNFNTASTVTVGKLYFYKTVKSSLVKMSDGSVYVDDSKFKSVADELKASGITEMSRRTKKVRSVYTRMFDGSDFLTKEEPTVFATIPIVPAYGNYSAYNGRGRWHGAVERLMDPARVHNYSFSRAVAEAAFSPRAKYWMTSKQATGNELTLSTLNSNDDPVQIYTSDANAPPPTWSGGAQINPGIQAIMSETSQAISATSGLFAANMGANPQLQSGVAIKQQISKGDNGTVKWFDSMRGMLCSVAKILVSSIPKVYDSTRTVHITGEDGSLDRKTINTSVLDEQTQTIVELNNLASGDYSATCDVVSGFKSQRQEAATAFADIARIDPNIIPMAQDVWFKNLDVPGMDLVAERARVQGIKSGAIPESQYTEKERQAIQARRQSAQGQQQPGPDMLLAQAQMLAAQASVKKAQNEEALVKIKAAQVSLDANKFNASQNSDNNATAAGIHQDQQKINMQISQQRFDAMLALQQAQQQQINDSITNLKTLREAIGVKSIVGPSNMHAYVDQAKIVDELQDPQMSSGQEHAQTANQSLAAGTNPLQNDNMAAETGPDSQNSPENG